MKPFRTMVACVVALPLLLAAQPRSAIEFYDSTGTDAAARFGWRGPKVEGKFYLEAPVGIEALRLEQGTLHVGGEVHAAGFAGDGSRLTNLPDPAGLSGKADKDHSHTLSEIAPNGIDSTHIRDGGVGNEDLAESSVTSAQIRDHSIRNQDIDALAAIDGTKISSDFGGQVVRTQAGLVLAGVTQGRHYRMWFDSYGGNDKLTIGKFENDTWIEPVLQSEFDPAHTSLAGSVHIDTLSTNHTVAPYSDTRLKRKMEPIRGAMEKIARFEGVYFEWVEESPNGQPLPDGRHVGLAAQEVERSLPEAVETDADGYKHVDYGAVVPLLVNAVREQQDQIEQLKRLVEELRQ